MGSENIQQAIPFFMVTDIHRSLKFYVEGLGFRMTRSWEPDGKLAWCWIERDGVALMLQEYGANDPRREVVKGSGVSICFQCADALALYTEFTGRGVTADEPFVGNNLWDVGLRDPDNYHLHFESPTEVPEETRYSDWLASGGK